MSAQRTPKLSREQVIRVCGDILDWQTNAIIASGADIDELGEAVAWASGQDDVMGEERKHFSGTVAELYEILTRGEEFAEEDRARFR
jgi:hypothetical protein